MASTHLWMLSISPWHTSGFILLHFSCTLSQSSKTPWEGTSYSPNFLFRWVLRCSIGFRSGDCAGHNKTSISWSWNQFLAFLQVCLGLLCCWKMMAPGSCHKMQGCFAGDPPESWYKGPHPFIQPPSTAYSPKLSKSLLQTPGFCQRMTVCLTNLSLISNLHWITDHFWDYFWDSFCDLNSNIADLGDPGLSLWGSLWLKIEGLYIHLLFNVAPLACIY